MLKNKKGFTLVELCIVIGLTAIIVTMCCGFIANNYRYSVLSTANVDAMTEITQVESMVKSWIESYDSNAYTISVSDSITLAAESTPDSQVADKASLKMTGKGLVWYDNSGAAVEVLELTCVTGIEFKKITKQVANNTESTEDSETEVAAEAGTSTVITCSMSLSDNRFIDTTYTLFSLTERNRFLSSERD